MQWSCIPLSVCLSGPSFLILTARGAYSTWLTRWQHATRSAYILARQWGGPTCLFFSHLINPEIYRHQSSVGHLANLRSALRHRELHDLSGVRWIKSRRECKHELSNCWDAYRGVAKAENCLKSNVHPQGVPLFVRGSGTPSNKRWLSSVVRFYAYIRISRLSWSA